MKKLFIIIPLTSVLAAVILISVYHQIESTRPVCIEGSFQNGTCKGAVLVESEQNVKKVTITGKDAQDMCAAMRIPCTSNPTFSAVDYGQFISTVFTVNQDIYEVRLNKTSVCVIPQTANSIPTCYPREDENKYFIEILDLQQNYTVNEPISFIVHEKGFDVRCFSVYAKILDSFGNKIWERSQAMECPPGLGKSNFDNLVPFEARINKSGSYDLFVESRGWELKRQFSVSDAQSSIQISKQSFSAEVLSNLKNGKPVTAEQANFIKNTALLDPAVQEFVRGRSWDFDCCAYVVDGADPTNPHLQMSFFDRENKKQLAVTIDLQNIKVIKTEVYESLKTR